MAVIDKLRFIPLGGITDVTKNMYVYELYNGDKLKEILIVDCGIGFPRERELGVDFVIPDISYLRDKTRMIRAVILSHGHEDHISALPYLYQQLGSPLILASRLTTVLVENKFREFGLKARSQMVKYNQLYQLGEFSLQFIPVTHSIPDTTHLLIKTPVGNFYHGSDYKLDLTPPYGPPPDFYAITKAGKEGVTALITDSLGIEREGLALSEKVVGSTFEDEMRRTKGRFIMTTFSSNISRIRQCCEAAIKFNRKIAFLGRSMKENTDLAKQINYLNLPQSVLAKESELMRIPPNRLCLIVAGSQGQYDSALSKLARDQNQYIRITSGDKVFFSSDPIPGNEQEVYELIESLIRKGAEVFYPDITEQLHASGHANIEDIKFLVRFIQPKYFIPIGGTVRHQRQFQRVVQTLGYDKNKVFTLNEGETVLFKKNTAEIGETIELKNIYIDAYGVGDVGQVVLRDRQTLAEEGGSYIIS